MKNIVKRMAALLITIMLVLSITGCSGNRAKDYTVDDMTITLTNSFVESTVETQTAVYSNDDYIVTILKQDYAQLESMNMPTDMDVGSYALMVVEENGLDTSLEIYESEVDDYSYIFGFTYEKEIEDTTFSYFATVYKSDDAYWFIQFATKTEQFEEAKPQFIEWAKTVRFADAANSSEAE